MHDEIQKYDSIRMRCLIAVHKRARQRDKNDALLPPGVLDFETIVQSDDFDTIASICTSVIPKDLSEESKQDLIAELVHRLEILYPEKAVLRVPSFLTTTREKCQASSTS